MSEIKDNKVPNVPPLRFSNDEWKRVRLDSFIISFPTNSLSWDDLNYDVGTIKNFHYGLIHNGFLSTVVNSSNPLFPYINEGKAPRKYEVIKNGDIILADASEDVECCANSIEVINNDESVVISGLHTIHCRDNKDLTVSGFKGFYFRSFAMKKQLRRLVQGTKIYSISTRNFKEMYMSIPSKNDQHKIVNLLTLIEDKIETQKKIIEDLSALKEAILQVYFSSYSKIDKLIWKTIKLDDILIERKEYCEKNGSYPHVTLSKDGISIKTERYDRDFLVTNENKEYKITRLNDICYNPANLKFGVISRNKYGNAIFSPIYVTFQVREQFDPEFVELVITYKDFIKKILRFQEGTVYERMAVSPKDFLSESITTPTKLDQINIVQRISLINKKQRNEEKILCKYIKSKKYLLQKMFI